MNTNTFINSIILLVCCSCLSAYRYMPKYHMMVMDQNRDRASGRNNPMFNSQFPERSFERRDGANNNMQVYGNVPDFVRDSPSGAIQSQSPQTQQQHQQQLDDKGSASKFARKNCFFSPLQCSFYYKRSQFPNLVL